MASAELTAESVAHERSLAIGAALVTVIVWASAFVGIRYADRDFGPGALALGRLLVGSVAGWSPHVGYRVGSGGVGFVLLARAIGDRRYIGFLKRERGTAFARRDTMLYSPLCLALGSVAAIVAAAS